MPQVPLATFEVDVSSLNEGRMICDVLAKYDLFQFENNVKPDYCNAGGVMFSHEHYDGGEWNDVPEDDEEWADILAEISSTMSPTCKEPM